MEKNNRFFILVDKSNSSGKSFTYAWIFKSKKAAMKHRVKQHKRKFGATLSLPQEFHFYNK